MYVIIRTLKVQKGYLDKYRENFKKISPIMESPGFVKKELYLQTKNKEYDVISTHIYFEDRKAFYVWEGSPAHIAMHRNKDSAHNQRAEEIIDVSREAFDLDATEYKV